MSRGRLVNEALKTLGVERCLLLGHSMGGAVATAAVSLEPDRYIDWGLIASLGFRPHRSFSGVLGCDFLSIALRLPFIAGRLIPRLRDECERMGFKGHDDQALVQMVHTVASFSFPQHAKNLGRLALPTLVAAATDDPLIEPAISEEFHWRCPSGPRLEFPDGGHNIQKSRAVELGRALDAWVRATSSR